MKYDKLLNELTKELFKPASKKDIKTRSKQYDKILLEKEAEAKEQFKKKYGSLLEVGDVLVTSKTYVDVDNWYVADELITRRPEDIKHKTQKPTNHINYFKVTSVYIAGKFEAKEQYDEVAQGMTLIEIDEIKKAHTRYMIDYEGAIDVLTYIDLLDPKVRAQEFDEIIRVEKGAAK